MAAGKIRTNHKMVAERYWGEFKNTGNLQARYPSTMKTVVSVAMRWMRFGEAASGTRKPICWYLLRYY